MVQFTDKSLPTAVADLFRLNNYTVQVNVEINGAEVDLIATSISDPFSPIIYIETTIQHVTSDKYGKDATKFLLIREKFPAATCILVTSSGFAPSTKERAEASRVVALTYDELFARFEKFSPYIEKVFSDSSLINFNSSYEEPVFRDSRGEDAVISWLRSWRDDSRQDGKWLILLGEYGTGKTSLTRVLQYRWTTDHKSDPLKPIPFRIELRSFTKQFDARALIHHFLDHNNLGHIPIEFVFHLIRTGRIVLILDGYDEMAQFLNARERRSCLSALAELSKEGAKGILTSRPNYFSEAEELRVFEALYRNLEQNNYRLGRSDRDYLQEEEAIDDLITKYLLDRYERQIRDLTPEQTESLVRRKLSFDPEGQEVVLKLLRTVFRQDDDGARVSLSGKPVIIAYLLELIDDLKVSGSEDPESLTEWEIYRLIVDRLMVRDQQRSPGLDPQRRRRCLQRLALHLSGTRDGVALEQIFHEIIDREFRTDFRLMDVEEKRHRRDELFEDLRGSATLTRAEIGGSPGWQFSHNSLREYLVSELATLSLAAHEPVELQIPISDAMRSFVGALATATYEGARSGLQAMWRQRHQRVNAGSYLSLFWDRMGADPETKLHELQQSLADGARDALPVDGVRLKGLNWPSAASERVLRLNGDRSEFADSSFDGLNLATSSFQEAAFDSVSFKGAILSGANFNKSLFFECDLRNVQFENASLREIDLTSSAVVSRYDGVPVTLSGLDLIGFMKFNGGITDDIDDYSIYKNHPKFAIVEKICGKLVEQRNRQLLGLTQKGESQGDPRFAREFVQMLRANGWIEISRHDLVSTTENGRTPIAALVSARRMDKSISDFLRAA